MNKIITVYDLLGLIKDGKAPKKIKYNNRTYEFKEIIEGTGYVYESGTVKFWLSNEIEFDISRCLNEKIEILEEDKPIIESISIIGKDIHKLENLGIYNIIEDIEAKLNEVIEFLNRKEDK